MDTSHKIITYLSRHQNKDAEIREKLKKPPFSNQATNNYTNLYEYDCGAFICNLHSWPSKKFVCLNQKRPYLFQYYFWKYDEYDFASIFIEKWDHILCECLFKIIAIEHRRERAARKIQNIVREWLDRPTWSNGKVGWGLRESWKEIQKCTEKFNATSHQSLS